MTQLGHSLGETIRRATPGARSGNGRHQDQRQEAPSQPWHEDRPQQQEQQEQKANVGDGERLVSVAAGSIVALLGLSRGTLPGLLVAGVGGALAYRGVTGHCPAYEALGLDTAHDAGAGRSREDEIAERGVHVTQAFVINRPASDLYRFWRDFENLPRIMEHLESVRVLDGDGRRSHWVAKAHGLGGKRFEWDAEITRDEPDRFLA